MNNLELKGNVKTIPSYEVAEMIGKRHKDVLLMLTGQNDKNGNTKIIGIIPTLEKNGEFNISDYFIKSTYKDKMNRTRVCYECTKLGCELIVNKMTGKKGILFAAKYAKKFNDMEKELSLANTKALALLRAVEGTGEESAMALKQYTDIRIQEETKPLQSVIDAVIDNSGLFDIGIIGKILKPYNNNFGSKKIFTYLRNEKILIDAPNTQRHNTPYDRYSKYFEVKTIQINKGSYHGTTYKTYLNGEGLKYILNRLAKNDMINPLDRDNVLKDISEELDNTESSFLVVNDAETY